MVERQLNRVSVTPKGYVTHNPSHTYTAFPGPVGLYYLMKVGSVEQVYESWAALEPNVWCLLLSTRERDGRIEEVCIFNH